MKVIIGIFLVFNFVFANEHLESIYENIILKNTTEAIQNIKKLREDIDKEKLQSIDKDFKDVVKSWKSIQSFYILGDLNEEYIDTPRYIDTFHHGNEDITIQLDKIIEDKEDLSISLYKNSHKTINALEYILFTKSLENKRVKNIAFIITDTMLKNMENIHQGYIKAKSSFIKDEQKANAVMLNSLIENSYKLKEWRIGDAAGLSRKYKGEPDNKRAEYFLSKSSRNAIEAIIDTHISLLDKQSFKNYGSLIKSYQIEEELSDAIKHLKSAKKNLELIKNDDFSNAKKLYNSVRKLHGVYYISLIGKLKVTAKVLDADGD